MEIEVPKCECWPRPHGDPLNVHPEAHQRDCPIRVAAVVADAMHRDQGQYTYDELWDKYSEARMKTMRMALGLKEAKRALEESHPKRALRIIKEALID